jgi:hypothetical protein
MSMIGHLRRISAAKYVQLKADPSGMAEAIGHDSRTMMKGAYNLAALTKDMPKEVMAQKLAAMPPQVRSMFEHMLAPAPAQVPPKVDIEGLGPEVVLEKMWHALHFLIARTPEETGPGAGRWILGGEPVGEPGGYGPARLLSPADVASIARELPNADTLRDSFDPRALAEADLYPSVWDEDPDELWEEISGYYKEARALYLDAANAGDAMVLWLD